MTTLVFLDTETTGIDRSTKPEGTGKLIQLAFLPVKDQFFKERPAQGFHPIWNHEPRKQYYRVPDGVEMDPEAMAVTQLTPEWLSLACGFDFEHAEDWTIQELRKLSLDPNAVFIAHNADFDRRVLEQYGIEPKRWICTKKVAALMYDLPSYKLQYLRYAIDEEKTNFLHRFNAHDAGADVQCMVLVFEMMLKFLDYLPSYSFEMLISGMEATTKQPMTIRRLKFGKYRGVTLEDIHRDDQEYLYWILNKMDDLDEDTRFSIEQELKKPRPPRLPPVEIAPQNPTLPI